MPVERTIAVRDGDRVREVPLLGVVTVGRSPSCEISDPDPRLSRSHAAFELVGSDVVVRDLGSRNGTRVNGVRITEHRLVAGETVEVGPFTLYLVGPPSPPAEEDREMSGAYDATVLMPPRARSAGPPHVSSGPPAAGAPRPSAASASRPLESPPASATTADSSDGADAPTRRIRRPPMPAKPSGAPAAPMAPPAARATSPVPVARHAQSAATPDTHAAAAARPPSKDLAFARATLIWILPVALVSFLGGLVPDLLQADQRAPLLQAHFAALATSAAELVRTVREPAVPLDGVSTALRRHTGVTTARILGADGRVLAPLDQAGTTLAVPALPGSSPRFTATASGIVDVHVPATTADGRPVVVALTVDPSRIHPAPTGSPIGTVLLVMCLALAWLVARRVTQIADARLSQLGEEVELMTTRQIVAGRDPFGLRGGQRILDAATFALSPAGRRPTDDLRSPTRPDEGAAAAPAGASIEVDEGFRIVSADPGCEALLGIAPGAAPGLHLIDALRDQAVADEVLRLVTLAIPEQGAQGVASPGGRDFRLGIAVTRSGGPTPLSIRFTRL